MIALYLLVGNLVGLGVGPPSVGTILDTLGTGVGQALAIVALPSVVLGALLLWRALPAHAARSQELTE